MPSTRVLTAALLVALALVLPGGWFGQDKGKAPPPAEKTAMEAR